MFYVELRAMVDENKPADRHSLVYLAEGGKISTYSAEFFNTEEEAEQAFLNSDLTGEQYENYTGYFYYKHNITS
ncbi:hypothetical protein N8257_00235 [Ulvibacter sp.]|nr:hypothetical protein [Ulvibacter sp.]|tara:strand:- start:281 stop:502 length:222 start_codon:yes stop_codon:yes gene_type:complete